jgi:hypothetical protein
VRVVDNSSSDQPRLYMRDTLNNRIIGFDDTNVSAEPLSDQTGWDGTLSWANPISTARFEWRFDL